MEEKVFEAALAGLLHDVGKVAQRAKDDPWKPPSDVADSGQPVHAAWSLRMASMMPKAYQRAAYAGGYHHQPEKSPAQDIFLSKVVALADKLSAGERADAPQDQDKKKPPQQMVSIFDKIVIDGVQQEGQHYLPVSPLSLDAIGNYIKSTKMASSDTKNPYDQLRLELEEALKKDIAEPEAYLEHLLAEMQRLTWCVPSAYYHSLPDISLYDHSRMTAALATCLVEQSPETVDQLLGAVKRSFDGKPQAGDEDILSQDIALLVGGDISGVQDFIYTISSKGAAKMLRGRSFYLQLLTEAVLRFVLRRLGLPYTNVIYSGGGHFYLLAPVSAKKQFSEIQAHVGQILLRQHGTQLYLVLGEASVPARGFQAGKLRDYWQVMHNELTRAKSRRYAELGADLYKNVFDVPEYGGNPNDNCSVCGDDQRGAEEWDEWEGQSKICPLCRSFAETIGKDLPDTRYLALKFRDAQLSEQKAPTALDILKVFGMEVQFLQDAQGSIELEGDEHIVIWALDDPKGGKWPQSPKAATQWLRYTANRVPPYTFDELQKKVEGGFERLGVLRMDVDNLGDIFSKGLGLSFSLSRMATLSFQVSLFFEGWLKRIVEKRNWKNLVYTVYSGGDDLFLLAPWDKVPVLAQCIVDDFANYTVHPDMHISGGMAFIDGKYPIYQAAEDAAEAEGLAKKSGKNAFGFLNRSWKWVDFRVLSEHKEELKALVLGEVADERRGPKSILHTLRDLAEMEENEIHKKGKPIWGRWMWMGAYQLARMEERYQKNTALKEKIVTLRKKLGIFQNLDVWGAAARWAQLETRKQTNSKLD
jgi:CRISPR-associated protein Csm1